MSRRYSTQGPLRDPRARAHYVYRLWDGNGALLYVGCSIRPLDRIKEHRSMAREMVDATARVTCQGPYNYQTARRIERDAILSEHPRCNADSPRARRRREAERRYHDQVFAELVENGVARSEAVGMASAAVRRAVVAGVFA